MTQTSYARSYYLDVVESLVIITGAGASAKLGRDGDLPMMPEWSDDLRRRLGPLADLLGLKSNMPGIEFEECIGSFLRFTAGLADVSRYPWIGYGNQMEPTGNAEAWFRQAQGTSEQIQRALFESLHELFGFDRIDGTRAECAYGALIRALRPEKLALATTNYDVSGELALQRLGFRPYSGHDGSLERGGLQAVHVDGIVERNPDRSPMLYLHGRVSWYLQSDGSISAADPESRYNPDSGTPALLLPDPEKSYGAASTVLLWQQLEQLTSRGDAVLVLGHSLNDARLVDVLRQHTVGPIAVSYCPPPEATDLDGLVMAERERLTSVIGTEPIVIPMVFGPQPKASLRAIQFFAESLNQGTDARYLLDELK